MATGIRNVKYIQGTDLDQLKVDVDAFIAALPGGDIVYDIQTNGVTQGIQGTIIATIVYGR